MMLTCRGESAHLTDTALLSVNLGRFTAICRKCRGGEGIAVQFEQILDGFVFLEAPRVDDHGNLWFSEVMDGGVHRLSPDGKVEGFITDRKYIGGLVLTEMAASSPRAGRGWNISIPGRANGGHWNSSMTEGRSSISTTSSPMTMAACSSAARTTR
jgi:hypothetical protein